MSETADAPETLLSVAALCEALGVDRQVIYNHIHRGRVVKGVRYQLATASDEPFLISETAAREFYGRLGRELRLDRARRVGALGTPEVGAERAVAQSGDTVSVQELERAIDRAEIARLQAVIEGLSRERDLLLAENARLSRERDVLNAAHVGVVTGLGGPTLPVVTPSGGES